MGDVWPWGFLLDCSLARPIVHPAGTGVNTQCCTKSHAPVVHSGLGCVNAKDDCVIPTGTRCINPPDFGRRRFSTRLYKI